MAYIDKINKNSVDYDLQDSKAARSVDGTTASHVEEANQIYTTTGVAQTEYFTYRTTAGDASINTGPATLVKIIGHTVQTGHTDEVLDVAGQFNDSGTSVAINKATWETTVTTDGTYTFYYDGENWKLSDATVTLATYGLTVTGTVAEGDNITVTYVKLVIGTLATTKPTSFVATGFNQYDATAGYAHVIGDNQYRIAGTYTSLGFATTVGGTTTPVTVTNGKFTPAEDGYIYVTGGVGDILIALVWSGSRDSDPYEAYSASTVTIPTADASSTALPIASYGMPSVGSVADELSFSDKKYYQRIGHYTYSSANLATVEAMGVDYVYDLNDIFYVLSDPIIFTLADTVDGAYTANDYGTEEFTGTSTSAGASLYYGNNLVDKLRNLADIQTIGTGLALTNGELTAGGGSSVTVVQTTGTSQSDVMSQNAVTSMVYADPANKTKVRISSGTASDNSVAIGYGSYSGEGVYGQGSVAIGYYANSYSAPESVALGYSTRCRGSRCVVIGCEAGKNGDANHNNGQIMLGAYSGATRQGEMNIGSSNTSYGFNSSNYRLISGVYDGQSDHDAVTLGQLNGRVLQNAGAPTTSTVGTVGQLLEDTTNGKLYQCTDATNPYVWSEVGAGGGSTTTIKALTSADKNWPTNNPTGIALWKLEPGIYRKGENGLEIWFCTGSSQSQANQQVDTNWGNYQGLFIVRPGISNGNPSSSRLVDVMAFSSSQTNLYAYLQWEIDNFLSDGYLSGSVVKVATENEFLPLTGTTAPTTSTSASYIGKIYIDTTNNDAYICLDRTSGNVLWKKITP